MAMKDITREDITKEHIESALKYLAEHGRRYMGARNKEGIIYLYNTAHSRGIRHEVNGKKDYFAIRDALRLAALYAVGEMPKNGLIDKEKFNSVPEEAIHNSWGTAKRAGLEVYALDRNAPQKIESDDEDLTFDDVADEAVALLKQFKQIILYGPPGTGKTYCAKTEILPQLLGVDTLADEQGKRWDIVQFHPSYNYEDFVRGVQVTTSDGKVVYETINRAFGEICKRAKNDLGKNYVLIIDEINRANVSAVLGELIYALEYRGKKIKTPYAVGEDGYTLVIPENLYIIGTMNTADRTIGQIDYAVRRRFAFVSCLPDESVITDNRARQIFSRVEEMFNKKTGHVSPDYEADDVRIGHSYFIAESNNELARKILYQVVPILQEYVKDGVLLKGAEDEIYKIKQQFSESDSGLDVSDNDTQETGRGGGYGIGCWDRGEGVHIDGIGRTVLAIVQDYANQNKEITLQELQEWFPGRNKHSDIHGIKSQFNEKHRYSFFTGKGEVLSIKGQAAYVTREWGSGDKYRGQAGSFEDFAQNIKQVEGGYNVHLCCVMNIIEKEGVRNWESCRKLKFISAGTGLNDSLGMDRFRDLKKGSIVFITVLNKGYVGMGEVLQEARPINEFKVGETLLLDSPCNDSGEKYGKRFPIAASQANDEENCEWVIPVRWMRDFSVEEAEGQTTPKVLVYYKVLKDNLNVIKQKFKGAK